MHYQLTAKNLMSQQYMTDFLEKLKNAEVGSSIELDLRDTFPMVRGLWSWRYQMDDLNPSVVPSVRRILSALRGNFTVVDLTIQLPQSSVWISGLAAALVAVLGLNFGGWGQIITLGLGAWFVGPTVKSEVQLYQSCSDFKEQILSAIKEHVPSLFRYSAVEVYIAEENAIRDRMQCVMPDTLLGEPRLSVERRKEDFLKCQSLGYESDDAASDAEDMSVGRASPALHFTSDTKVTDLHVAETAGSQKHLKIS